MTQPLIDREQALRLCVSLISDFQKEQIRQGRLSDGNLVYRVLANRSPRSAPSLEVTEEILGIDSLMLLDVVMKLTRFFGLSASGVEDYLIVKKSLGEWADLVAWHFEELGEEAELTFATSGTTGRPKNTTHNYASLALEIDTLANSVLLGASGKGRIISLVAPHHIYGCIWGVLLPSRLGKQCLDLSQAAPSAWARIAKAGDIVLATPYLWERYASFGLRPLPDVWGICSGGPTRHQTWQAAEHLGLASFHEIYGSTETGGLGWRIDKDEPLQLMHHLQRVGDKTVRSPFNKDFDLQDRLEWVCAHTFQVAGRKDNVVQIAGTNVCIDQVEQVLLRTALVQSAYVRPDGGRLKAYIVPHDPSTAGLERMLRSALLELPAVARPNCFTFGRELPRTEFGKLCDWF